jgi:NAD(P)H-hydrate epimerase
VADVQVDRPAAVRQLSARFGGCWVVLKGHQTLVGASSGPVFVNSSGNPGLAQGGSGDLLAGYLAGLVAQPALQGDPAFALRYAVWQHGAAADRLSQARAGWTIEELATELGG